MPFPTRLLLEGEQIALDLRPHWWFFVGPVAAGIPVLALVIAVGTQAEGDVQTAGWWLSAAVALAWAVWLVGRLLRWTTTHFVVTSDRLIHRSGVFAKHGRDIPLERVNDIASSQTFFERMIGAGDLLIESAGERGQQKFTDISRPDHVQQEIYRQMESNANRTAAAGFHAAGSPGRQSVPEQIAALAQLRDQGVISNAEFEAKKADLLSRM
ncbi:MAG TPA: PH domain-containing protein [Acidimicrobiia bacterium]|nr:PH domain-containing protein [Acidimicrobiia bacterium]